MPDKPFPPPLRLPGSRLPGEPVGAGSADEARRWVATYRELLQIERAALSAMRTAMQQATAAVRDELNRSNALALEQDVDYFTARLALWEARLAKITG